jgi:hypothetical protein
MSAISFGQDILVKRDSSKIEAKVLEIRPSEIKYKYFNYQEGPTLIVLKNEIAYVIYQNGQSEYFQILAAPVNQTVYVDINAILKAKKDSLRKVSKISDYVKFNVQAGVVFNNSYSNLTRREPYPSHTSSESYSGKNDVKYNFNPNIGVNFILGNNPYVKHIIGVNYLRSTGEYNYDYSSGYNYTSYKRHVHYTSKVDFINLLTGIRFHVGKHINLEPMIALNIAANSNVTITGTSVTTTVSGGPPYGILGQETIYYKDAPVGKYEKNIGTTVSFCPRVSYEFNIKQQTLGACFSYNMAYQFRLPWYMIGVTYYPFKKLNGPLDGKKLQLFKHIEVSVDAGVVFNNRYANIGRGRNNSYKSPLYDADYFEIKKPRNHKETGLNLGINLAHGNSSFCKHIIGLSYIQSKSEFIRTIGHHYTESDKYYDYWNTTHYTSTVHFLNVSTGIRLTAFKHLNFDNSIAYTIPLFAINKMNGSEFTREQSPIGNGYYYESGYSEQTINTTSSELFVRPALSFIPRVSFDFKIGQQRFGCYYSYNISMEYRLPWNMMGISYYPFKKLR